jgi:hypothetical protein
MALGLRPAIDRKALAVGPPDRIGLSATQDEDVTAHVRG